MSWVLIRYQDNIVENYDKIIDNIYKLSSIGDMSSVKYYNQMRWIVYQINDFLLSVDKLEEKNGRDGRMGRKWDSSAIAKMVMLYFRWYGYAKREIDVDLLSVYYIEEQIAHHDDDLKGDWIF